MHKLGIIVPYRDRYEQLEYFKKYMISYLYKLKIKYELIIIEQDNAKLFNRGVLLNIGFKYAKKLKCDYVIFHDVDMIPIDADYSYSDKPLHLATYFEKNKKMNRIVFDEYFGGVTLFPIEDFEKINGYSNKYWGWGFEDSDLLLRCKQGNIKLDEKKIKNNGNYKPSLKFNGLDSYVICNNIINLDSNLTFFVSFCPDDIICDHNKMSDIYTVFSIPGYDTSISYTSYSRYNFCTFDIKKNALYINSNIKTNYRTNICITIDKYNSIITAYQDGDKIGSVEIENELMTYNKKYFYLGVGDLKRKTDERFFKGFINNFVVFSDILGENEIKEISNSDNILTQDFGDYVSSNLIKLYYDTRYIKGYKLTDISRNGNDGEIFKCEIVDVDNEEYKKFKFPYRRKSKFRLLEHEENGFVGDGWKSDLIRWNQLRFHNEVSKNYDLLKNDGLSDLKFVEHGKIKNKNIIQITVGI